ncbi:MAG: hypothetical protein EBZ77_02570 [Chitinophagia bacterium]|nr:hypothetical protein [Chitinophagia bacterium]
MTAALRRLPSLLGAEVVRFSMSAFRAQAWEGNPWKPRAANAKNNKGRAILVKSGRLRRSIRVLRTTTAVVVVGSDVPYAKAHNEGLAETVNVSAHTRRVKVTTAKSKQMSAVRNVRAHNRRMKIPMRRYLGDAPQLRANCRRIVQKEFSTALKPFTS